jgi:hypothetical protein
MDEGEKEKMANGQAFIKVIRLPEGTWDTFAEVHTLTEEGYNKLLRDEDLGSGDVVDSEKVFDPKFI